MEGISQLDLDQFIVAALREDVGDGDHTSLATIDPHSTSAAHLLAKDIGVVAGVELAERVFKYLDPDTVFEGLIKDGQSIEYGDIVFIIRCNTQALLKGERLALNVMQRMSGIASLSRLYKREVEDLPVTILDTRKTTPLLRFLEKWAVRIGGCTNYRDGLYDRIMIKDNHVDASGSIALAIDRVKEYLKNTNRNLEMTVEVRNLNEMNQVLQAGGVQRIMLDNFDLETMREAVSIIDKKVEVEASGGVTLETVRDIALTGVDFISSGELTHSAGSLDLSLKIRK